MADDSRGDSKTKKRKFRFFRKKRNKNKSDDSVYTTDEPPVANKQQVQFAVATDQITAAASHRPPRQEANMLRKSILHNNCKAPVDQRLQTTNMHRSWLGQTRFFKKMAESAFQTVDADGSGEVDEKELYSGLLLIHLKLGSYAGPAACKVSSISF
jgi:hypothetical protein